MNKQWVLFVVLFALFSCAGNHDSGKRDKSNKISNATLPGTYFARLPCDGCSGILVDAVLESDHTYSLAIQNADEEDIQFANGTWRKEGNRILLTKDNTDEANSASVNIRILQIVSDRLMILDDNGNPYTQNAERYLFNKK